MKYTETIIRSIRGPVATITLNRPRVRHAINLEMIRELTASFNHYNSDTTIRIIHLRSDGEHFCAGADLKWMKEGLNQSEEKLLGESLELARLFILMRNISPIVVTSVQGKVMGGANGLVAASDLVLAEENTGFAFPEVKLGLIPATIAPFVIKRIGKSKAAAWMISGRSFSAKEALGAGLLDFICETGQLEADSEKLIRDLLSGGPRAMAGIKKMINTYDAGENMEDLLQNSAQILARLRKAAEGQEGMKAFLEKRKPGWDCSEEL